MKVRQVLLRAGRSQMTAWLRDGGLRPNVTLTLKGDDRLWTVEQVYDPVMEQADLPRGWHVGGMA